MSAETLRKAATLMRERAQAALPKVRAFDEDWFETGCPALNSFRSSEQSHIVSWNPAAALAVAAWLDSTANDVEHVHDPIYNLTSTTVARAIAVARAYLGDL